MNDVKLPPYSVLQLSNGMTVVLMEDKKLPLVNFYLIIKSGIISEPEGKEGLSGIVMKMIKRGTEKKKGIAVTEEIESLGGTINSFAHYDYSAITGEFLSKDSKKGFRLFSEILLKPCFPENELLKLKNKTIAEIITVRDNPSSLSNRFHKRFLFCRHPYARSSLGTLRDIQSIERNDLVDYYSKFFVPKNFILFVGGDFNSGKILKIIEQVFGENNGKRVNENTFKDPKEIKGKKILIVDKHDLTQTQLRFGNIGVRKRAPDLFNIIVANNILGGSFGSRLMQEIRVKNGLTYGIRSHFSTKLYKGDFTISTFTKNKTVPEVIFLIVKEMEKMKREKVTEEELERNKRYLCGVFPLSLETTSLKLKFLGSIFFYNLDREFIENYVKNINSVSGEDILTVARNYFDTDNFAITALSNAGQIRTSLAKIGEVMIKNYREEL